MPNDDSQKKKTGKNIINAYKASGMLAIAPLYFSGQFITASGGGGSYDISGAFRLLGWLSLPVTIAVTPVFAVMGAVGAVGSTLYAAGAFPIASIKDAVKKRKIHLAGAVEKEDEEGDENEIDELVLQRAREDNSRNNQRASSSRRMHELMPQQVSAAPEEAIAEAVIAQSIATTRIMPQMLRATPAPDLSAYSSHTRSYIKSFKKSFAEKLRELEQALSENNDALTSQEKELFEKFKDPITCEYMEIPVMLNERYYDLATLTKLNKDPETREDFIPREIQSGRKLVKKFDHLILQIKQNHPSLTSPIIDIKTSI